MNFIFSIAITLTFGLMFLQCDNSKIADKGAAKSNANSAVKTNTTVPPPAAHTDDDAPRITLADAKSDFDSGSAIFVDSRPADSYKVEHIKGSINIPLGEFEAKYKDIPTDKKIIVYCS